MPNGEFTTPGTGRGEKGEPALRNFWANLKGQAHFFFVNFGDLNLADAILHWKLLHFLLIQKFQLFFNYFFRLSISVIT